MAGEEEIKKVWPSGYPEAKTIDDFEYIMTGKNNEPLTKFQKDKYKQYLSTTGQRMKSVAPGALPAGPSDKEMYMVLESPGRWTFGGNNFDNVEGQLMTLWWDRTAYSVSSIAVLPVPQGVDTIDPDGEDLPTEKAVAVFVEDKTVKLTHGKNYFNPQNTGINELVTNSGTIGHSIGWGWSGYIDIRSIPIGGAIRLESDKNRTGLAFFPRKGAQGRYIQSNTGLYYRQAGDDYMGFNLYSPTENSYTWAQVENNTVATTYEPFKKIVPKDSVQDLEGAITNSENAIISANDSKLKLESFSIIQGTSKNLLNPNLKIPNSLLDLNTGKFITNLTYNGLDLTRVEPNTNYIIRTESNNPAFFRQIAYFDSTGIFKNGTSTTSFSAFTTGDNVYYIRGAIAKTTVEDFTRIGIFKEGESWEPYHSFKEPILTEQRETFLKDGEAIATIKDVKEIVSVGDSKGFNYRIDSFGNLNINDGKGNSIGGQIANKRGFSGNDMFNFIQSAFKGITVGSSDDVAPMHIFNTTLGANHGYAQYLATITAHGFDNTVIGKEFLKEGVKFYPLRIVDANTIAFISDNAGTDLNWVFTPLTTGAITLNSVSYIIGAVLSAQLYPSLGINRLEAFIDNNKIEVGAILVGKARNIKVVEDYDIYNTSNMLTRTKSRAGSAQEPDMVGDAVAKVRNVYNFSENYSCVITSEVLFKQAVPFADIMGNQAVRIGFDPLYYLPNSKPIGVVDLRKPFKIPISTSNPNLYINVNNNDPLNPPDRLVQYIGNAGFIIGYLPGYNDYSKTARLFEIRGNSGKVYPHPIEGSKVGLTTHVNDYYNIKLYRSYTDLSLTRKEGRLSYFIVDNDAETFIFLDYSANMFDDAYIDIPELNGKTIEVIQSSNTILMSKTFNQGLIVNAIYAEGETTFMVVKIKG